MQHHIAIILLVIWNKKMNFLRNEIDKFLLSNETDILYFKSEIISVKMFKIKMK